MTVFGRWTEKRTSRESIGLTMHWWFNSHVECNSHVRCESQARLLHLWSMHVNPMQWCSNQESLILLVLDGLVKSNVQSTSLCRRWKWKLLGIDCRILVIIYCWNLVKCEWHFSFGGFYVVSPKSVFGVSSLVLQDKLMGNCCRNPSAKHKMKNTLLGCIFLCVWLCVLIVLGI